MSGVASTVPVPDTEMVRGICIGSMPRHLRRPARPASRPAARGTRQTIETDSHWEDSWGCRVAGTGILTGLEFQTCSDYHSGPQVALQQRPFVHGHVGPMQNSRLAVLLGLALAGSSLALAQDPAQVAGSSRRRQARRRARRHLHGLPRHCRLPERLPVVPGAEARWPAPRIRRPRAPGLQESDPAPQDHARPGRVPVRPGHAGYRRVLCQRRRHPEGLQPRRHRRRQKPPPASPATARAASASPPTGRRWPASTRTTSSTRWANTRPVSARTRSWAARPSA